MGCSQFEGGIGWSDSWTGIANPVMLQNVHVLLLCQDEEDPTAFTYRLNLVHSNLKSEVFLSALTCGELLNPWCFDRADSFIFSLPVVTVAPLVFPNGRHSFGLHSKQTSLREVIRFLYQVQLHRKAQVVIGKRGPGGASLLGGANSRG